MSKSLVVDAELYSILYTGIIVSDCELNRKELRAIGRVLSIVENHGKQNDDGTYSLVLEGTNKTAIIEIDKYDLDVLNKVLGVVKWKPLAARRIVRLFDALEEAIGES